MPDERYPPDDPREWLRRAKSNLIQAESGQSHPEIYLEDLCFDAQQCAEKAIKAVMLHYKIEFPYIHDLGHLLNLIIKAGFDVPNSIKQAAILTEYAVAARYPGLSEPVAQEEYREAVRIARHVLTWATKIIPD